MFFDWVDDLDQCNDADAWKIVKAIKEYYVTGENPVDLVKKPLKATMAMIYHQIQRGEDIRKKRSDAGQQGGNAKANKNFAQANENFAKANSSKQKFSQANENLLKQNVPTITDTNTITDTVYPSDIQKKKNIKKEKASPKAPLHAYGEFNNVMLTDEELEKLKGKFNDCEERIETLSSYIASTGKKYKSHYATILNWAKRDKDKTEGVTSNERNEPNNKDDSTFAGLGNWIY